MEPIRTDLRRFRMLGLLKWTGTVGCVLILLAAGACLRWMYLGVSDYARWELGISAGALSAAWGPPPDPTLRRRVTHRLEVPVEWPAGATWRMIGGLWRRCAVWPSFDGASLAAGYVSIPLWMPFILIAIPTALLWRLDRRRIAPGCCVRCGYDLRGTPERCPECGTTTRARL